MFMPPKQPSCTRQPASSKDITVQKQRKNVTVTAIVLIQRQAIATVLMPRLVVRSFWATQFFVQDKLLGATVTVLAIVKIIPNFALAMMPKPKLVVIAVVVERDSKATVSSFVRLVLCPFVYLAINYNICWWRWRIPFFYLRSGTLIHIQARVVIMRLDHSFDWYWNRETKISVSSRRGVTNISPRFKFKMEVSLFAFKECMYS